MSLRQLTTRILWLTGAAAAARALLTRGGRFVLTFHGVAARRYAELPPAVQPAHSADELRATLRWIARRFRFLGVEALLRGEEPGVLLTFDDGFANARASALPVLEELAAPAVFFVTVQHCRQPRDWLPATREQVCRHWAREEDVPESVARDLYDGLGQAELRSFARHPLVTIGSHTLHHPFLTRCSDAELASELAESKRRLEDWCGQAIDLFAYPSGDYDQRVAVATRAAGYRAAFAEDPVGVAPKVFEIPRIGLYQSEASYLAAKLSGLHRRPLRGAVSP